MHCPVVSRPQDLSAEFAEVEECVLVGAGAQVKIPCCKSTGECFDALRERSPRMI